MNTTSTRSQLYTRSIEIIKANQSPEGAYIASPNFEQYHYSWFRDGTYIAYSMDLVGEHESAERFYSWASRAVVARGPQVDEAIEDIANGGTPAPDDILHTRYTAEGKVSDNEWPNFQLDGFGTLLWGMSEHLSLTSQTLDNLPASWSEAVVVLIKYLGAFWSVPCYDCWEEFGDKIHTYTLAALYGGLQSASRMLESQKEHNGALSADAAGIAMRIRQYVLENCVEDGALCKYVGNNVVDSNLIMVGTPYGLLAPDDPVMQATIARIESELRQDGDGVHRYAKDSYYGGGEWVLLTAYLGWYYIERGDAERAQALLAWVERCATEDDELSEQIACHLNYPDMLPVWEEKWGKVATPLLWSHGAYLTLVSHLEKREASSKK